MRLKPAQPRPKSSSQYRVCFLSPSEIDQSPGIRDEWEKLAKASGNLYALFQSPVWWDYTVPPKEGVQVAVGVVLAADGSLVGAVPVRYFRHALTFGFGRWKLPSSYVHAVQILGGQPLLPDLHAPYVELIRSLFDAFPECDGIYLESILTSSYWLRLISESLDLRRLAVTHVEQGMTPHHIITLPGSFEEYLAKFKPKTRYNLRRQVKRLRERGSGRLDLVRIENEADAQPFLNSASMIEANAWQYRALGQHIANTPESCRKLARLASHGALRSYLLHCGDEDCAFVSGFQYGGVFYYSWCGFDQRLAEFSPGTVLLYLLIEDLCRYRKPKQLTFLWGDAGYKDLFGTDCLSDAMVLLARRKGRLSGRLRIRLHAEFHRLAQLVKEFLR